MEWYDREERALFAQTGDKFAKWVVENNDPAKIRERTAPGQFNWEMIKQGERAGLLCAPMPENLGGAGLDPIGRAVVLERIGRGAAGAAAIFAVHWAGLITLACFADDERIGKTLSQFSEKAMDARPWLCGVALPAAVIDSKDTSGLKAEKAGGGIVLSGEFICPLHPALMERALISAPTEKEQMLLLIPGKDLAPFCKDAYPGTGLLEMPIARLNLREFKASADSLVASGEKAKEAINLLRGAIYSGLSSAMAGNARAAAEYAWEYSRQRIQTGRLIIEHQEVRRVLENMNTLVEASWAMVCSGAAVENSEQALGRLRRAFLFSGTACEQVCLDAIQCLGGYGYMEDYPLERRLRDLKTIQCLLGSYALEWMGTSC